MAEKQRCFISYNRDDCDHDTIEKMINYLTKVSNNSIEFLWDRKLQIGKDFSRFMDCIKEVEAIIVLLTPGYKRKADDRITDSGVYVEFQEILKRLEKDRTNKQNDFEYINSQSTFCFIPIVFSRNDKESCPQAIKLYNWLDFTTLQFVGEKLINSIETTYDSHFRQICSEISAIKSINSESVKRDYEEQLQKLLFHETKQDNISKSFIGQTKELYVKTRSFNDLRAQKNYLFLGRKGSGKSTLGPLLYLLENERYKNHIEINVDEINLEYLINIVFSASLRKDFDVVIRVSEFFKLAWEILLIYECCKVLISESDSGNLSDSQEKNITSIKNLVKKVEKSKARQLVDTNDARVNNSTFQWCISSIINYIERSIKESRNEDASFHYDINTFLQRGNVLKGVFSNVVLKNVYSIIGECKRLFFISFDGFDSMFEKFRINTNNLEDEEFKKFRRNIEIGFLEGFLNLTMDIKSNPRNDVIYAKMNLCVTVPKDRFFEIKELQRDSYRYIEVFQEIKWTGIELSIMLRKRLELRFDEFISKKNDSAKDRLLSVINKNSVLSLLPQTTTITFNNRNYDIDTFLNILRHTFGRPREVIIYYSKLIAVARDFKKKNHVIDNFAVSKIISETTFDIINEEFISEFKNYCRNIRAILLIFKNSAQTLSRSELENKLGAINFDFISGEIKDFKLKLEFLFDIGFIGIEVPKKTMESHKLLICDIFSFNASDKTFEILKGDDFDGCKFIIHPIFCEYLGLDLVNQNRLVLNINWDYIIKQDLYVRP